MALITRTYSIVSGGRCALPYTLSFCVLGPYVPLSMWRASAHARTTAFTHMYAYTPTCMNTHKHTHDVMHTHTHVKSQKYTLTRTHTRTHTQVRQYRQDLQLSDTALAQAESSLHGLMAQRSALSHLHMVRC